MSRCFRATSRLCVDCQTHKPFSVSLRAHASAVPYPNSRANAAYDCNLPHHLAISKAHRLICSSSALVDQSKQHSVRAVAWPGLEAWRGSGVDKRRVWGDKGAVSSDDAQVAATQTPCSTLTGLARQVLQTADPKQKAVLTHQAWQQYSAGLIHVGSAEAPASPSRPERPQLVPPRKVPTPKQSPLPLPVYMLHNLAHVELNAIDLAWDTVVRFSSLNLDQAFYRDFARVADDESRHLSWCLQRLEELGYAYGDMVAHSILWDGAAASNGDLTGRLAVVPMSQEARGLDAGPRLADRLVGCGDNRSAAIVSQIAAEEKAHVAVGVHWFCQLSAAAGEDPGRAYRKYMTLLGQEEVLRPPYNHASRQEVGLQQDWYDRSMWPENMQMASVQVPAAARTQNERASIDTMSPDMLDSLRKRMATMLDTELSSSA